MDLCKNETRHAFKAVVAQWATDLKGKNSNPRTVNLPLIDC